MDLRAVGSNFAVNRDGMKNTKISIKLSHCLNGFISGIFLFGCHINAI